MKLEKYLTPEVIAGGLTAVLAALALATREQRQASGMTGMGVSVRTLNHTALLPGTSDKFDGVALAKWCDDNEVRFVELLACWIDKDSGLSKRYLPPEAAQVANELRAAGVKVGIWGWPDPRGDALYRERMTDAFELVGAEWIKHDPERPYHGAGPYSKAQRVESAASIMEWSTAIAPTDVTSYGSGPKSHPSFVWEPWSKGARYGRPQWYDKDSDWSPTKVASFAESWKTLFPTLCPILSAVNSNTPQMMRDEADRFLPVAGGPIFSYWDFYWLAISSARTAAAAEIGAKYRLGA